ncbi:hypothetical protein AMTR_s00057p00088900 [Amborella trichopoda]|uniref:Uncharacterized protein n=1 Tax=Amborella trichopoda TaxID=13333 RepID=U5D2Z2_AMBTC|nr:hypothetical protein AMTR_s00057p00088900 [Amborella trichopoda]
MNELRNNLLQQSVCASVIGNIDIAKPTWQQHLPIIGNTPVPTDTKLLGHHQGPLSDDASNRTTHHHTVSYPRLSRPQKDHLVD